VSIVVDVDDVVVVVVDTYASIVVDVVVVEAYASIVVEEAAGGVVDVDDGAAFAHIYIADTTSESIIPSLVALA